MASKKSGKSPISPFPSDAVSQSIKQGAEWNKTWIKAADAEATRGLVGNIESLRSKFVDLRKHAAGNHDIDKFKPMLSSFGNTAFLNLNWNVATPLPTIVESLVGRFENQDIKLLVESTSPLSQTEYDKEFRKIKANATLALNAKKLEKVGVNVKDKIKGEVIFDDKEIELYLDMNFKDSYTSAMQSVINYVLKANKFKQTRRKLYRDLIVCGRTVVRTSFDSNYDIRVDLCDITEFISDYTIKDDYSDCKYMGEYIYPTIDELAKSGEFTESQLFDIAQKCEGKFNNSPWDTTWGTKYYNHITTDSFRPYGRFKVKVLWAEYRSRDKYKYEVIPQKSGGEFLRRIDKLDKNGNAKKPKDPKNEIIEKEIINVYRAKYIVGTDYIYEYGLKENQLFEKGINGSYLPEAMFSWIPIAPDIYDMENKSIVQKMIPDADELILVRLRAQTLIAKMKPQGLAIDVIALAAATNALGEERLSLRKIQDIYEQTGNLYYASTDENGEPIPNNLPIKELPEYELAALAQLEAKAASLVQNMTLASGVPLSTVGAPDTDSLVGNAKIAAQNRNDATRYIDTAYASLIERMGTCIVLMAQDAIEGGKKLDDFQAAIGESAANTLKFTENLCGIQFGIFTKAAPDIIEQEFFNQTLLAAMGADKIKQSDVYELQELSKTDIRAASNYMRIYEKRYAEEKQAANLQAIQAQSQANAQAALAQSQGKIQEISAEWRLKLQYLQAEYGLKSQESAQDHQEKMKEIILESDSKIEQIEAAMSGQAREEGGGQTSQYESLGMPKASGVRLPSVSTGVPKPNI